MTSVQIALAAEVERLRHDIERHVEIACELATECERLRAELAERKATTPAPKSDCRTCDRYAHYRSGHFCRLCTRTGVLVCINGDHYVATSPVRLYETERGV
jgi:regulator of replication initiation timing